MRLKVARIFVHWINGVRIHGVFFVERVLVDHKSSFFPKGLNIVSGFRYMRNTDSVLRIKLALSTRLAESIIDMIKICL